MSNSLLDKSGPVRTFVATLAVVCVFALLLPNSAQAHTGSAGAPTSHWFSYGPTALEQCVAHRDSGGNPLCSYTCPWFAGDNVTSGYSLLESCLWSGQYQIASFIYPDKPCRSGQSFLEPGTCSGTDDGVPNPEKNFGCPSHKADVENGKKGNPCDAATGNKFQTETDFTGGQGVPVVLRHYNSGLASLGFVSHQLTMGRGWTGMHLPRFETNGSLASVTQLTMRRADGKGIPFYRVSGSWGTDADLGMRLTEGGGATLTLTLRDGTVERYGSSGNISSITDPTGLTTTFTLSGLVNIAITGPFGHRLTFGYSSGRIATITDPDQKTISYSYDADNNLSRVDYPDNTARIYHYENLSYPNFLTGISYASINPDGSLSNVARYSTYDYNSIGKAISTRHAETDNGAPQETFTFNYDNYYTNSETTVTSAPGSTIAVPEVMIFAATLGVQNLVSKVNSVDGKSLNQTFDSSGNLICKKDEENRVTLYSYNSTNQKLSMTEGLSGTDCNVCIANPANCNVGGVGRVTTYDYLSPTFDLPRFIRRPSVASSQTFETELVYGEAGHPNLPTQIIQRGFTPSNASVSRTITLGYNPSGQVNSINGPRTDVSDITTLEYYECTTGGTCGQLKKVTNALGHITTYDLYDANGRLKQMTDPNGLKTSYTYDPRGRVKTITQTPTSGPTAITQYSYTPWGDVNQVIDPDGVVLNYQYDAAHYLRFIVDDAGNYIHYAYDIKGNRTVDATYDQSGVLRRSMGYAYDLRNHLSSATLANDTTQLVYDAVGNLKQETDPNFHTTTHTPDALNRLMSSLDALNGTTGYGYDLNDRPVAITTPNNRTTKYSYDDLGNLLTETSPDRGKTTYTYDTAGNALTVTDVRNITTTYIYDALNRVLTKQSSDTSTPSYVFYYDACGNKGRLCYIYQNSTTQLLFSYDSFGRRNYQLDFTTWLYSSYSLSPAGRLTHIDYPNGVAVDYQYDTLGRVSQVSTTDANGITTTLASNLTYQPFGPTSSFTFGNGQTYAVTLDQAYRPTSQQTGPRQKTASYDPAGNLYKLDDVSSTQTFTYDPVNALASATDTQPGSYGSLAYDYLSNGNRQSETRNGNTLTYTYFRNQLQDTGSQYWFYDAAGNAYWSNYAYVMGYDGYGRMTSALSGTATYTYDAFNRRIRKSSGGITTSFHYGPQGELLYETRGGGKAYVYLNGLPLARIDGGTTIYYYHTDQLGAPQIMTNSAGTTVWKANYEPFGQATVNEDPDGDGVLVKNNVRLAGMYADSETGLFYNWNRYYDPKIGRYISSDPVGLDGGLNTYLYANANPLRYIDPDGLCPQILDTGQFLGAIGRERCARNGQFSYLQYQNRSQFVGTLIGTEGDCSCGKKTQVCVYSLVLRTWERKTPCGGGPFSPWMDFAEGPARTLRVTVDCKTGKADRNDFLLSN